VLNRLGGRPIQGAVHSYPMIPATARRLVRAVLAVAVFAGGAAAVQAVRPTYAGPAVAAAETSGVPLRVMPLGDSLTWGKGSRDDAGYRRSLYAGLTAAGLDVDFVGSQHNGGFADPDNEGHPGWRIDQVAAHVGDWLAAQSPDVVLLDIGTNDYIHDYDTVFVPARLADLIDRITTQSPDVRVVVAKLLVVQGDTRARGIRAFNAAMTRIVAARGLRVSLADMSRIPASNTVDGTHPTGAGYRQMAYQWYQALRRVLPGGGGWPAVADPFPLPAVRLARSAPAVRRGGSVTLTARLDGRLTGADLARVPVRLSFRRAGTDAWVAQGTARTGADGRVRFARRATATGYFVATVAAGRAAGRHSGAVKVSSR
jgi:lysophospholipase L1-like esterase